MFFSARHKNSYRLQVTSCKLLGISVSLIVFLLFPSKTFAGSVVINEFSSNNDTDWVEVYNNSDSTIDLSDYSFKDGSSSGNEVFLNCVLAKGAYYAIDWSNKLNNNGDTISLLNGGETVDCVAYGDGSVCSGKNSVDLEKLEVGEYGVRNPEGTGVWVKSTSSSNSGNSQCSTPSPSPSPLSSPSPAPAENYSVDCNIREVKDSDGSNLSNVKVHVDGVYLGHYAPETITFCDNCRCDDLVDCGFGEHTFGLKKSGYQDWSQKKTINKGDACEINAVMNLSVSEPEPGPFETPSSLPAPSPQVLGKSADKSAEGKKENVSSEDMKVYDASFSGEVFGASESAEDKSKEKQEENERKNKNWLLPLGLSGSGLLLLGAAAFPMIKPKLLKTGILSRFYDRQK